MRTLSHSFVLLTLLAGVAAQAQILYDHGPMVTHATGGAGGLAASALDNTSVFHPPHVVYGFGAQWAAGAGNSLADDFTVSGTWTVTEVEVFGYLTNATPPTVTGVYVQIWDGDPRLPGSQVVRGDLYNNLLSTWPAGGFECYRTLINGLGASNRHVQSVRVPVNWAPLQAGVYWFEIQLQGVSWVPPVTEPEINSTGDAIQRQTANWVVLNNSALPDTAGVSVPIRLYGTQVGGITPRQGIYGSAKPGTHGLPAWALNKPTVGRDLHLEIVSGVPGQVPMVIMGFGRIEVPIPSIGTLFTYPTAVLSMPPFDANQRSVMRLPVPHGSHLCGLEVDFQGVWLDGGATGSVAHTGGMAAKLGGGGGEPFDVDVNVKVGKVRIESLGHGASAANVQYTSNPTVATATINATGLGILQVEITGHSPGVCIIIVNYTDNTGKRRTARFYVTVKV